MAEVAERDRCFGAARFNHDSALCRAFSHLYRGACEDCFCVAVLPIGIRPKLSEIMGSRVPRGCPYSIGGSGLPIPPFLEYGRQSL
jgi:hypothetical protein